MAKVDGFDYVTGKAVAYTPAEWRAKYPPGLYDRATTGAKGETWYRARLHVTTTQAGKLAAEAYAIVPKGKG